VFEFVANLLFFNKWVKEWPSQPFPPRCRQEVVSSYLLGVRLSRTQRPHRGDCHLPPFSIAPRVKENYTSSGEILPVLFSLYYIIEPKATNPRFSKKRFGILRLLTIEIRLVFIDRNRRLTNLSR
jgi:hypothetical protein